MFLRIFVRSWNFHERVQGNFLSYTHSVTHDLDTSCTRLHIIDTNTPSLVYNYPYYSASMLTSDSKLELSFRSNIILAPSDVFNFSVVTVLRFHCAFCVFILSSISTWFRVTCKCQRCSIEKCDSHKNFLQDENWALNVLSRTRFKCSCEWVALESEMRQNYARIRSC